MQLQRLVFDQSFEIMGELVDIRGCRYSNRLSKIRALSFVSNIRQLKPNYSTDANYPVHVMEKIAKDYVIFKITKGKSFNKYKLMLNGGFD